MRNWKSTLLAVPFVLLFGLINDAHALRCSAVGSDGKSCAKWEDFFDCRGDVKNCVPLDVEASPTRPRDEVGPAPGRTSTRYLDVNPARMNCTQLNHAVIYIQRQIRQIEAAIPQMRVTVEKAQAEISSGGPYSEDKIGAARNAAEQACAQAAAIVTGERECNEINGRMICRAPPMTAEQQRVRRNCTIKQSDYNQLANGKAQAQAAIEANPVQRAERSLEEAKSYLKELRKIQSEKNCR